VIRYGFLSLSSSEKKRVWVRCAEADCRQGGAQPEQRQAFAKIRTLKHTPWTLRKKMAQIVDLVRIPD
jgi:hypothetical protein